MTKRLVRLISVLVILSNLLPFNVLAVRALTPPPTLPAPLAPAPHREMPVNLWANPAFAPVSLSVPDTPAVLPDVGAVSSQPATLSPMLSLFEHLPSVGPRPFSVAGAIPEPETVTDAAGQYRFTGLEKGTHKVTFAPASLPLNLQPAGAETTPTLWINPNETLVSDALSTGVRITAFYNAATGAVSGVVFWDQDGDGRQSAEEPGLAGVTVIDPTLHQYFVPFYDQDLWDLFEGKAACHNVGDAANLPMVSNIFVTASSNGTIYYYDHWEDGYDPDPLNPGATTQVGILDAGATQLFQSNIDPVRVGSAPYYYDGRDRITIFGESANVIRRVNASSYTLTGELQSDSGGWLAGAWEVPEVADWGREYIATVGEDLNYGTGQDGASDFDFTGLSVTARQDGTVVSYIHAHDGSIVTYNLDAGEVAFIDGADDGPNGLGVDSRDRISASAPVQVQMLAGACSSEIVSADGYTMQPVDKWDTTYWAPVPGFDPTCLDPDAAFDDADTDIYLHNPHSYNIVVTVHSNNAVVRSLTITANSTISILHETGWDDLAIGTYGTYITSDETFWGVSAVDSATDGATGADDWDWGYSLISQSELSSQVIVGYAPGRPVDATSGSLNGNMAFVIAVTDTTIFVDLNQNRTADAFDMNGDGDVLDNNVFGVAAWDEPGSATGIPLAAGQVLRIGDPVDYNLVGARIYTPDPSQKIAVAWGQDPCAADYLTHEDMGYTIFPHPVPSFSKIDELAVDSDTTGDITPGDILTYTMVIFNNGFGALSNAVLTDSLPYTYSSFVVGSMGISTPPALGGIEYSNDGVDFNAQENPDIQAFRITWPVIASFQSVTVTFLITLNNTIPETVTQITNQAVIGARNNPPVKSEDPDDPTDPDTDTPIGRPNLSLAKTASAEVITPGQSFTYTIIAANTGTGVAIDFSLTDSLPPHLQYVPDSLNLTWPVARVFTTTQTVTHTRSDGTQYADVIVTRQTELVYNTITGGNPLDYAATPMIITNGLRLPSSGVITAAFRVTAAVPLTNGLELVNAATISATNWATPTVATVPVRITSSHVLSITKTDDPDPVIPGEVLTYTMVYSAAGNEPAPDTIITDTTPPSTTFVAAYGGLSVVAPPPGATGLITWALGTLLPPASGVVTMVVRVDPDRVDPLLNYVRISDRTGAHADDDEPTALLFADVAIRKIVEPAGAVAVGDVITWTLVYSNEGQVAAQNVTLTDVLPAGVTFGGVVRTTPVLPAPVISSPTLTWTLPAPLAVNASGSIVLTATVNSGYPYLTNTVVIRTTTPETNTTNNHDSTTTPVVGLAIHKEVLTSPVQVGEAVSYRIAVTNTGAVALARVPLTDTYESAYLRFESASPSQSDLPSVGMIVWDNIGPLAVGASARVAVTFTAVASTAVGYASPNEAVASGQTAGGRSVGPVTDTARVEIRAPELRLRKTSQNEGGYPAYPGEVLTYTLAVSNVGLGVATNVVVRDTVPVGTSYVAGSIRGGDSRSDAGLPELAWTVNRLDAGEGVTVSFAVRLDGDLGDGTAVVNTGSVTSTEVITPVRSTVTDTVTLPAPAPDLPDLTASKRVTISPNVYSSTVRYTVNITNTGEVAFSALRLTDTLPEGLTYAGNAFPIAPTSITGQVLRWNDVLVPPYSAPFLPTQVITVSYDVRVTTRIPGQYQNIITATGVYTTGELTATAHTPLVVADPAIALDKALVPPGVVNGLVTYTIRLTNTGPSVLDVVPLFDVYDASYLKFLRATPTENLSTTGHIQWSDLTAPGPNGFGVNMIPGQTFVITTAFKVIKEITETITNTARAEGVIDIWGNPVKPVKDDVPINEGAPPGAPNAVTLLYFRAVAANNAVTLRWATANEVDNRGFVIWRSPAENPADVTQLTFIAAQGTGTGGGYSYQYPDKTVIRGQAYTYWLADVAYNGVETLHGPVTLSLDRFSKVYLPVIVK